MVEEAPMSAVLRCHLSFPSHRDHVARAMPWGLILYKNMNDIFIS